VRKEQIRVIEELALATIDAARVPVGGCRDGKGPNVTGISVITPGGHYPAFWIRDFAMAADSGLFGAGEVLAQFRLTARHQAADCERRLASGAIIPAFAIPDHINLDDTTVFYPGTYSSGEDQGSPPWGPLPPIDDHYYFVHLATVVRGMTRDSTFLTERIDGVSALDRLDRAFGAVSSDPRTGAVVTDAERRAVGFGFQDTVYLLGALSFVTLLRWRAARELADLHEAVGGRTRASGYRQIADLIAANLVPLFMDHARDGWLAAATLVGRQPDVWATLFALHLGVLPPAAAERACATVAAAVRAPGRTVEYQGAVRHVPSDRWVHGDRCWESGGSTAGTYQSGAYWHTPTGWLIQALEEVDPRLAEEVSERFIRHLLAEDFREGGTKGAPYECFGLEMKNAQNPVYVTSVAAPLAVLQGAGCSSPISSCQSAYQIGRPAP
jgi:hypothetical protein